MTDQLTLDDLLPAAPPEAEDQTVALYLIGGDEGPVPDQAFVRSIRRFGVIEPVILRETGAPSGHGNPPYGIVDGRRRVAAARLAELLAVPARVYPKERPTTFLDPLLTLVCNVQRSHNPVAELAAIERLTAAGADESTIARATGISPQTVKKRVRLSHLIPPLMRALAGGTLGVGVGEQAAKLPAATQERLAARLAERGRLTADDVRAEREARTEDAVAQLPADLFASEDAGIGADYSQIIPEDHQDHLPVGCAAILPDELALYRRLVAAARMIADGKMAEMNEVRRVLEELDALGASNG